MTFSLKYNSSFFQSKEDALEFLMNLNIIKELVNCPQCNNFTLKLRKYSASNQKVFYRCTFNRCRKTSSIFKPDFVNTKVPLNDFLYMFFCFLINMKNYTFVLNSDISEPTFIKFKTNLYFIINDYLEIKFQKIGGEGVRVQLDETAICRRRIITNPTSETDEIHDTVWLFGGIEERNRKNFFLVICENRRAPELTRLVNNYVLPGTVLVTDGYPSYPTVASNLEMEHIVVNHTMGFLNEDGFHTNYIENLWSDLKIFISSMRGVRYDSYDYYLAFFIFRKKYIDHYNKEELKDTFEYFLNKFFI